MSAAKSQIPLNNDPKICTVAISNMTPRNIRSRINSLDWPRISASLHESGWARTGEVLTPQECDGLRALYSNDNLFRSKVVMARHRFGLVSINILHIRFLSLSLICVSRCTHGWPQPPTIGKAN
jgi:hypothetical protein